MWLSALIHVYIVYIYLSIYLSIYLYIYTHVAYVRLLPQSVIGDGHDISSHSEQSVGVFFRSFDQFIVYEMQRVVDAPILAIQEMLFSFHKGLYF